jgi:CBS domain-containing protein
MRVADVMTANVITVVPETSVRDLAALLRQHGISGVPVVDKDNRLIGIVSERDLPHRTEIGTERRTASLESFAADEDVACDHVKALGRTVRQVMTRDVVTVPEMADVDVVADLLTTRRIKLVPVARDGALVGIVSRVDLMRVLTVASPSLSGCGFR